MRRVLTIALLTGLSFSATAGEPLKPLSFRAEARVEVDADGKLVKVEASQDLPEGVRRYIEQQVATWKFIHHPREGATGNATSWLTLGACAVPKDDGTYSMGMALHGYGPRIANGGRWKFTGGLAKSAGRYRVTGLATVHFTVHPDGRAEMTSIDGIERNRKVMEKPIRLWVADQRFDPETIGGAPVATRETIAIDFRDGSDDPPVTRESLLDKAMISPQCLQAGMVAGGMQGVAVDSVMSIEPSI